MERNTRSIIPPSQMSSNKPRNAISPREMNSNYNHQSHYNNYNQQNHQSSQQQHHHSHPPPPPPYHPNSDLINFVSSAWKEKVSSDKTEYFHNPEATNSTTEKANSFDLDGWLNAKMRNS